jgi:DNA end-binding protein Ku
MVSIPVRLYKAARRERVRFRHVYAPEPELAAVEPEPEPEPETAVEPPRFQAVTPVRETVIAADDEEKPIPRQSILKGYETAKDEYVVFKPSEIAALRPRTSSELPIVEFVRLDEIDPIFFDTSYYVAPDQGGERPFALLAAALARTGHAALGSLAMHGREHAVAIRAAGDRVILHTLFYANEVRADEAWRADAAVNEKELGLAAMLVESMAAPFDASKLKDTFEERLRVLIEARAPTPAAHAALPREAPAPAIDIMEALRKSIAAARKPVTPERNVKRDRRRRA